MIKFELNHESTVNSITLFSFGPIYFKINRIKNLNTQIIKKNYKTFSRKGRSLCNSNSMFHFQFVLYVCFCSERRSQVVLNFLAPQYKIGHPLISASFFYCLLIKLQFMTLPFFFTRKQFYSLLNPPHQTSRLWIFSTQIIQRQFYIASAL